MRLPDAFIIDIQDRWDNLENSKWGIGELIGDLLVEYPVLERTVLLKAIVSNTTCNYSSLDDYERVYRYWQNEERYDLNWSQMRACISSDIKDQRKLALLATEKRLSADKIYRFKTGKTWREDVERLSSKLRRVISENEIPKKIAPDLMIASRALEQALLVAVRIPEV